MRGSGPGGTCCQDKSPYGAWICNLDLLISRVHRVHRALPFTQQIPSQIWVLWHPLILFLSERGQGRGVRCPLAASSNQLFPGSRTALYCLNLVCSWAFSPWKVFLLIFSATLLRVRWVKCVCSRSGRMVNSGWDVERKGKRFHRFLGGFFATSARRYTV